MNPIDVNTLLTQMRTLAAQSKLSLPAVEQNKAAGGLDFGSLLKQSIGSVDQSLRAASNLTTAFERGESSADIGQVMVALQKADLSFRTMSEVRNKLVDAYKDIMNMQI